MLGVGRRYERGQYHTSDPVEEQRQRDFKSLLNKITPEKFDVIKVKLVEVGIEEARTLIGLIDQACPPSDCCCCVCMRPARAFSLRLAGLPALPMHGCCRMPPCLSE